MTWFDTMTRSTWNVLDHGEVPPSSTLIEFDCPKCGWTATVPVIGRPIAQLAGGGIVFETSQYDMPPRIRCRRCRTTFVKQI